MKRAAVLASAMCVVLVTSQASAALITFTSRAAWEAAIGGSDYTVDFQSFGADTQFRTVSVDAGPFSLVQTGVYSADPSFRNVIDVPPHSFTDNGGTSHSSSFVESNDVVGIDMTFDAPVFAWGADFFGVNDGGEGLQIEFLTSGGPQTLNISALLAVSNGFFGFLSTPAESISNIHFAAASTIAGATGEGFGMDNVSAAFTSAAVPEPSTMAMAGMCAFAGLVAKRRKQRATAAESA